MLCMPDWSDLGGCPAFEYAYRAALAAHAANLAINTEQARALLAHTDSRTTDRIYRRKVEQVKPLK